MSGWTDKEREQVRAWLEAYCATPVDGIDAVMDACWPLIEKRMNDRPRSVTGVHERLADAEAERDRYREALEVIAVDEYISAHDTPPLMWRQCQRVAREALGEAKP